MALTLVSACKKRTPTGPDPIDPSAPIPWQQWKSDFQQVVPVGSPVRFKDSNGNDIPVTIEDLMVSPSPGSGIILWSPGAFSSCATGKECFQQKSRVCYDGPTNSEGRFAIYVRFFLSETRGQFLNSRTGRTMTGIKPEGGRFCEVFDNTVVGSGGFWSSFPNFVPSWLDVSVEYIESYDGNGNPTRIMGSVSFPLNYHAE